MLTFVTEQRSSSLLLAIVIIVGVLLIGLLAVVPIITILTGGGPFGDDPEQTPVVASTSEVTVDIRDFGYFPRNLTIDAGAKVTWTNYDSAPHTATDKDDAWDTGQLDKDESATLSFDERGIYSYYCTFHPYMKATLTVR